MADFADSEGPRGGSQVRQPPMLTIDKTQLQIPRVSLLLGIIHKASVAGVRLQPIATVMTALGW